MSAFLLGLTLGLLGGAMFGAWFMMATVVAALETKLPKSTQAEVKEALSR